MSYKDNNKKTHKTEDDLDLQIKSWDDIITESKHTKDKEIKSLADLGLDDDYDFAYKNLSSFKNEDSVNEPRSRSQRVTDGKRRKSKKNQKPSSVTKAATDLVGSAMMKSYRSDSASDNDYLLDIDPDRNTILFDTPALPGEDDHIRSWDRAGQYRNNRSTSETRTSRQRSGSSSGNGAGSSGSSGDGKKGRKRKKKSVFGRILIALILLLLITGVTAAVAVTSIALTAPKINPSEIYSMLSETSIIYDDQGNILEEIHTAETRTNVNFSDLPENLVNAFIAVEDKTFYEHHGFNFVRIIGAIADSFKSDSQVSGTSTITQQLARNLYLTKERSMTRKIREAYYTIQLEELLSKEQIIEAYLNTIYLGYNAYGVQAAAQAYFSKDVQELTLEECATLASIPKSPTKFAPLKRLESSSVDPNNPNIILRDDTYTVVYDESFVDRQHTVLNLMKDQEMITEEEYNTAYSVYMKTAMRPSVNTYENISSYFSDYLKKEVIQDLMTQFNTDENSARNMLYTGGLRIYSTINVGYQQIIENKFEENRNFPSVTGLKKDKSGNVLDSNRSIILYNKNNYFTSNGDFRLNPSEYEVDPAGNLVLYAGKRLNFYKTEVQGVVDYSIEFKNMYYVEGGVFYVINGGTIVIPADSKTRDEATGNIIINKAFLDNNGDFFVFGDGGVTIPQGHFTLRQSVIQPQSAMVITDYATGSIKAMVGGRSVRGKLLFNRASNPHPPGSSIKPIGTYGPAIQSGVTDDTGWTAGSTIEDSPNYDANGKLWPRNWYSSYKGWITLRTCVEQSVNVPSVRLVEDIGYDRSVAFLKNLGISSIMDTDYNSAALALGGMTVGISPIEMASAYGAFPNRGIYIQPSTYSKITNSSGGVIIEKQHITTQAMDPGVAFIMTNILRTTVSNGIAGRASISSQPVGGKTGTTTNNYDAWFVGFTPQYSAALWIGNDVNIQLSQGSAAASGLWSAIMQDVCKDIPRGEYAPMPENVERRNGEYFVKGTKATGKKTSDDTDLPEEVNPEESPDNPATEDGQTSGTDGVTTDNGSGTGSGSGNNPTGSNGVKTDPPASSGGNSNNGSGNSSGNPSGGGTSGNSSGGSNGGSTSGNNSSGSSGDGISSDNTPQDGIVNDPV